MNIKTGKVTYMTNAEKQPERKNNMTKERCMELLNQVINHVSVAHNTKQQIYELLLIGFTADELIDEFNFDEDDVNDALFEFDD